MTRREFMTAATGIAVIPRKIEEETVMVELRSRLGATIIGKITVEFDELRAGDVFRTVERGTERPTSPWLTATGVPYHVTNERGVKTLAVTCE